jgi:hypothetical protein
MLIARDVIPFEQLLKAYHLKLGISQPISKLELIMECSFSGKLSYEETELMIV